MSALNEELALALAHYGLVGFEREVQIVPDRKWRFDFARRDLMIGLEADGGAFRGRHAGGKYLRQSHERQNAAELAGWIVLRFTKDMIRERDGLLVAETVRAALIKRNK